MKTLHTLPALALLSLLAACGGGGGGGQQPDVGSTPTNQNAAQTPAAPNTAANTTGTTSTANTPSTASNNTYIAPKITEPATPEYNANTTTVNGHVFNNTEATDFAKIFPLGYSQSQFSQVETKPKPSSNSPYRSSREEGQIKAYHLPHSIILGSTLIKLIRDDQEIDLKTLHPTYTDFAPAAIGEFTKPEIVHKMSGSFHYKGIAISNSTQGVFTYEVNFSRKTGSGKITNLQDYGNITLHKAPITNQIDSTLFNGLTPKPISGIEGKATGSNLGNHAEYRLGFFGPKAEEIAGHIETTILGDNGNPVYTLQPIGFSGSRQ